MKKHLSSNLAMILIAISASYFVSCQKEGKDFASVQPSESSMESTTNSVDAGIRPRSLGLSVNVSKQNGRLIFESEQDFETAMEEIKQLNTKDWNNTIGFNSMWSQLNVQYTQVELEDMDELPIMDDEALLGVLNPNGIVQINPWIFKLNGDNKTVYVLPVSKINKINLLDNAIPSDADILTFSFDDDVFYMLETGGSEKGCDGGCADSDDQGEGTMDQYCSREVGNKTVKYARKGRVSYRKGGIWKVMKMKFKHKCKDGGGSDKTTFGFIYEYFYQNKCNETGSGIMTEADHIHPIYGTLIYNVWHDNKHVQEFYHGTRCLSNFSVHYPGDVEKSVEVIHLDQCLIDDGGNGNLNYDIGTISGS